MKNKTMDGSFEKLIRQILSDEILKMINSQFKANKLATPKTYLTVKEAAEKTRIGVYTLNDLTRRRAMPHLRVKSRILFLEEEILPTIIEYRKNGWKDPDGNWEVQKIQKQLNSYANKKKEDYPMIEDTIRKILNEELNEFAQEIKGYSKKDDSFYGRTNMSVKEAAKYFRTSNATIMSLIHDEGMPHFRLGSRYIIQLEEAETFLWRQTAEKCASSGNIYWQKVLQRLDDEESKRKAALEKALDKLEKSF